MKEKYVQPKLRSQEVQGVSSLIEHSAISVNVSMLLMLSVFISLIVLIAILAVGVEGILSHGEIGRSIKENNISHTLIFSVFSFVLLVFVPAATMFFVKRTKIFMMILVLAFAFSEMNIPVVHTLAFGFRYLFLFSIIIVGVYQLISRDIKFGVLEKMAIMLLVWEFIVLILGGAHISSITMMPIQIFLLLGVIIGLRFKFNCISDIRSFCFILSWCGLVLTATHLISVVSPSAFTAGRFKSFYVLSTNYGNAYILLLVPMLWRAVIEKKNNTKIIFICATVVGVGLLLLSGTRNSIGFLVISILLFSFLWKKKMGIYILISGLVLVSSAPLFLANNQAFDYLSKRLTHVAGGSKDAREHVWELSWELIKLKPVIGYGFGRILEEMEKKVASWAVLDAHNAYLGIWIQIGAPGVLLLLAIYFWVLMLGYKMLVFNSKLLNMQEKEVLVLPLALLSGLFAAGMFEENLTSRGSIQQLLWALSIVMIYMIYKSKRSH